MPIIKNFLTEFNSIANDNQGNPFLSHPRVGFMQLSKFPHAII